MTKILIVEDEASYQRLYESALSDQESLQILAALHAEEALSLFEANPDIRLIVMDGCLGGDRLNTTGIVMKFRHTFKGPMIAASRDAGYRRRLMEAGCDHEAKKIDVAQKILELLGLPANT